MNINIHIKDIFEALRHRFYKCEGVFLIILVLTMGSSMYCIYEIPCLAFIRNNWLLSSTLVIGLSLGVAFLITDLYKYVRKCSALSKKERIAQRESIDKLRQQLNYFSSDENRVLKGTLENENVLPSKIPEVYASNLVQSGIMEETYILTNKKIYKIKPIYLKELSRHFKSKA